MLRRQRQGFGKRFAMQHGQHIGRGLIALGDRPRRIALDKTFAAEILGDQEAGFEIGVMDRRRRKPRSRKPLAIATNGLTSSARCTAAL